MSFSGKISNMEDDLLQLLSKNFLENSQAHAETFINGVADYLRFHSSGEKVIADYSSLELDQLKHKLEKARTEVQMKDSLICLLKSAVEVSQVVTEKYLKK